MKETEKDTNKWENILCSWTELILLQNPYYTKPHTDSMQSLSKFQWHFHSNNANNPKICIDPQKTLNSQNNLEKEQI